MKATKIIHRCDSCGKSFTQSSSLKTHIHTVHKDHKDYKCKSCGKLVTKATTLRKHIHTVHENHKDDKC